MTEVSRRNFLKLTAAGGAAAGGLGMPSFDQWVSPASQPREVPPAHVAYYATVCRECPAGCGLYGTYRDGRVRKAEGNPQHPVNRGTLCARGQSSVQGLYDPDRLQRVQQGAGGTAGVSLAWPAAIAAIAGSLRSGGRAVLVSDLQTGSLAEVMQAFVERFGGQDRLLFHEPFNCEALKAAHRSLFGVPVVPTYRLEACEFVISFAADFLETWVSPVEFAHQFASMHSLNNGMMGRMAYVGPRLSMTATNADDFVQVEPGEIRWVALAMLREMVDRGWARQDLSPLGPRLKEVLSSLPAIPEAPREKIVSLAERFACSRASVALAGPAGASGEIATDIAIAAGLLNYAAGRIGQTVDLSRPHALSRTASREQMQRLFEGLGPQDVLFVHRANPVYDWPGCVPHIRRAGLVVYMGTLPTETARLAHWVLPTSYPLEAWGDYAPYPDVQGLIQPTMTQLYPDTWLPGDILLEIARAAGAPLARLGATAPAAGFREWMTGYWVEHASRPGKGTAKGAVLPAEVQRRGGIFTASSAPASQPRLRMPDLSIRPAAATSAASQAAELWAWGHVLLFDGRLANRTWMQENTEPVSQIVWGSWIDIHPERAGALGVADNDIIELATGTGTIRAPARVTGDVAPGTVAVAFGQGHTAMGRVAGGVGANAWLLLGSGRPESVFARVEVRKTGSSRPAISLQATQRQHDRDIVKWEDQKRLQGTKPAEKEAITWPGPAGYLKERDLYQPHEHRGHRWAMAIDLQRCIGCQACAVACYAENNIPTMGARQCAAGREMAWLKVVPYRQQEDRSRVGWLVLPCQHCDAAPCEPVCPVYAAVHNEEGLNAQIYNRCIGTRYCSNNCPYKVRRFNWLDPKFEPPLNVQLNPEVTVRCRGVMEKCTFCVQRIRRAEYRARLERRKIRDGEIETACQQTCPTRAIEFGDLMDPRSQVRRIFENDPRRYQVLRELNTKPAVVYLKRIRQV